MQILFGALLGAFICAVAWIYTLTRRIVQLEVERSVLFDRLLIKAGQPPITYEREQVLKIPDMDAVPLPNIFDQALMEDQILEEAERIRPSYKGLSLADIQQRDPGVYNEAVRAYQTQTQPLRT